MTIQGEYNDKKRRVDMTKIPFSVKLRHHPILGGHDLLDYHKEPEEQ